MRQILSQIVMDANVPFKALVPNDLQEACLALIDSLNVPPAVPSLWIYEITSAFAKAVHFEQLTEDEGRNGLTRALGLHPHVIAPDEDLAQSAYAWTRRLGRASAYDSFYLALAEAAGVDFWTADRRLYNALKDSVLWLRWIEEVQ